LLQVLSKATSKSAPPWKWIPSWLLQAPRLTTSRPSVGLDEGVTPPRGSQVPSRYWMLSMPHPFQFGVPVTSTMSSRRVCPLPSFTSTLLSSTSQLAPS
jgi:hypothetical protein